MSEAENIMKTHGSTRYKFAMTATILTFALLFTGQLSDAGEVAAFAFLGTVAAGFGVSKASEYWKKFV